MVDEVNIRSEICLCLAKKLSLEKILSLYPLEFSENRWEKSLQHSKMWFLDWEVFKRVMNIDFACCSIDPTPRPGSIFEVIFTILTHLLAIQIEDFWWMTFYNKFVRDLTCRALGLKRRPSAPGFERPFLWVPGWWGSTGSDKCRIVISWVGSGCICKKEKMVNHPIFEKPSQFVKRHIGNSGFSV